MSMLDPNARRNPFNMGRRDRRCLTTTERRVRKRIMTRASRRAARRVARFETDHLTQTWADIGVEIDAAFVALLTAIDHMGLYRAIRYKAPQDAHIDGFDDPWYPGEDEEEPEDWYMDDIRWEIEDMWCDRERSVPDLHRDMIDAWMSGALSA